MPEKPPEPMPPKPDTPNADSLTIGVSSDARWFLFDFTVGAKHALLTVALDAIASAAESMLNALSHVPKSVLSAKGLQAQRVQESPVIAAVEFGVATAPLDDLVVAEFELPGQVQLRLSFLPHDAEKMGSALLAGAAKAKQARNLPRQ